MKNALNGTVLPANQTAEEDLSDALDNIFAHQNIGPFISKQLIQRLVTSNPSPAYIKRVASLFNNNGQGVKGDMKTVIRAILLDSEAREGHKNSNLVVGKLKEPILKASTVFRAFNAQGNFQEKDGLVYPFRTLRMYGIDAKFAQRPYGAFSVFNFYRPDFSPAGQLNTQGLVAPEFQILDDGTLPLTTNRFTHYAFSDRDDDNRKPTFNYNAGLGFLTLDYSREKMLAENSQNLVDRLNLLLMAGQMSPNMQENLISLIDAIEIKSDADISRRIIETIHMILITPEFSFQH